MRIHLYELRNQRKERQDERNELLIKISKLEKLLHDKDERIRQLTTRLEDLEQYTRKKDV